MFALIVRKTDKVFFRNETSPEEIMFYNNLVQLSYKTWPSFVEKFSTQTYIPPETDLKQLVFNVSR